MRTCLKLCTHLLLFTTSPLLSKLLKPSSLANIAQSSLTSSLCRVCTEHTQPWTEFFAVSGTYPLPPFHLPLLSFFYTQASLISFCSTEIRFMPVVRYQVVFAIHANFTQFCLSCWCIVGFVGASSALNQHPAIQVPLLVALNLRRGERCMQGVKLCRLSKFEYLAGRTPRSQIVCRCLRTSQDVGSMSLWIWIGS